jgi:hypothetical protein
MKPLALPMGEFSVCKSRLQALSVIAMGWVGGRAKSLANLDEVL